MSKKYFAPGRVNLIGEHIDYNGGMVLPAAISLGITATVHESDSGFIQFSSATHPIKKVLRIGEEIEYDYAQDWLNYPLGVVKHLQQKGFSIPSIAIRFESTLPEGSGLSSSAAIEVLTMFILLRETGADVSKKEIAVWCKEVENNFIGVQCGIMDQFAIANAKANHALLLDCNTLEYDLIPADFDAYDLMILNTKKPRNLIHSKYNERKTECEQALLSINQNLNSSPLKNLCEATREHLNFVRDEVIRKRARHVITEGERVQQFVAALKHNDIYELGRLLSLAHHSLKHDYEVSGLELDTMVAAALATDGCIGARMTGAGFGGCAIALVEKTKADFFQHCVGEQYKKATGINAEIYACNISDGVSLLLN